MRVRLGHQRRPNIGQQRLANLRVYEHVDKYDTIDDDRIETAINNLARRNPNITGDVGMGGEPSPSAPEHTVLEGHEEIAWAV